MMKKIRFNSLSLIDRDVLRASLREKLLAQDTEIRGMGGHVVIKDAWHLAEGRIKVRGEVRLDDDSFHHFIRVIDPVFPPSIR
jgi:hypothetical protein